MLVSRHVSLVTIDMSLVNLFSVHFFAPRTSHFTFMQLAVVADANLDQELDGLDMDVLVKLETASTVPSSRHRARALLNHGVSAFLHVRM